MLRPRRIVVVGLSISSSWGNTHAATYRSVLGAMARRGHDVFFLERDLPWYAAHRDLSEWDQVRVGFYTSLHDLRSQYRAAVRAADVVIVGSSVPEGSDVLDWVGRNVLGVLMFYDLDAPLTVARLEAGEPCAYLRRDQLTRLDTVLSFAAGPALDRMELLGAPRARTLCGSIDRGVHQPVLETPRWDLGYLGEYAAWRQPALERLLIDVARRRPAQRFVVAGPLYPAVAAWPANVDRIGHLPASAHADFYGRQRFTLDLSGADGRPPKQAPGTRLFEAAACGTAVITDAAQDLDEFLEPYVEMLPASTAGDVEQYLDLTDRERRTIGQRARDRILAAHTSDHRALELEAFVAEALGTQQLTRARMNASPQ